MSKERLYIKVILRNQAEEQKKKGGGEPPKPFKAVTPSLRRNLVSRIEGVETQFSKAPSEAQAVPVRVTLEEKARAKSHRPNILFSPDTCPIIGAGKPGELFVKITPDGTAALKRQISKGESDQILKEISTINNIEAISAEDRLSGVSVEELLGNAPSRGKRKLIKVKLFDLGDPSAQSNTAIAFEMLLFKHDLTYARLDQFQDQDIYVVECENVDDIYVLANAVMVRSVGRVPVFRTLREQQFNLRPLPSVLPSLSADPTDYPIVAVVDSGISSNTQPLQDWIYKREKYVAREEENTYHGTFVAALLTWGDVLNSSLQELAAHPCRVLDVHVLPNSDPSFGPVGEVTESELLTDLEDALARHANEVKVWNLSLGSDEVCTLDKFSDFAIQLDNLQEKYGVTFVIAAGNYNDPPLLGYPRSDNAAQAARITSPADSVLGITVGSIAQIDHPSTGTRRGEPSPFSRNGPGPNYIIKPDLVHFGGNIAKDLTYPLGVASVSNVSSVGENIGTSFSTPLVSRDLAYIHHKITPSPSPTLARAILTHNARDIRTGGRVQDGDDRYLGFGVPLRIDRALECEPWFTTLVFEETIRPGYYLEWDHFPFPESLIKGGKFRGEIWMTLAYQPKRHPTWGSEYCETYLEAHFGVWRNGKDQNGQPKEKFHGLVPPEHNNPGEMYESFQVEKLRKWAPVRTYHTLIPNGVGGKRWRLMVNMLCRHGVEEDGLNQPFGLLLTIADPERKAPIYDEMARILRTRFKSRNLLLRPTIQVRANS